MTASSKLAPVAPEQPTIFVRPIQTPPGLPWDQTKAALLQAKRAAPIDLSELTLRLFRIKPWRLKASGEFGVAYVRSDQVGGGFETMARLGAAVFKVRFEPQARARTRHAQIVSGVATGVLAAALLSIALGSAVTMRTENEASLRDMEQRAERDRRKSLQQGQARRQSASLEAVSNRGRPAESVLDDLAAAARARQHDVPIEAFHWRADGTAVEVRGDGQPFAEGQASKIAKPLRPGVWLWVRPPQPERP